MADPAPPDVTISGTPADLLRWIWNRETAELTPVSIKGNPETLKELHECVVAATQKRAACRIRATRGARARGSAGTFGDRL
jgi:hypothetical protein